MKLSTKGRYGLRAMVDLAMNSSGEHVALSHVAEREGLSVQYLEQVFSTLRKAGLVKSVKGAGGGYTLSKEPSLITAGSILRAMEGDLSIVGKSKDDGTSPTVVEQCIRESLWDRIDESIVSIIDEVTIQQLADDTKKKNAEKALMFYI
ncbi:MAG: RrF2 family transcriptional regulator [Clostridiales bacterium]|nr:RrF2 family transcriptional regulator [Clostridiales bacterium]